MKATVVKKRQLRTLNLFSDEKETPSNERETDSEEEQPKPKVATSSNQRVPVFPGMSPAGLLVSSRSSQEQLQCVF